MPISTSKAAKSLDGSNILIHANPKLGKTTGAASFPDHCFVFTEQGARWMPGVTRWEAADGRYVPRDYQEFRTAIQEVVASKPRWVIIDTIDKWVEMVIEDIIANTPGATDINDGKMLGFGRGMQKVAEKTVDFIETLMGLPFGVVFISHSTYETVEPRVGDTYSRAIPSVRDKSKKETPVLTALASQMDLILYLEGDGKKTKLRATPHSHYLAGARGNVKVKEEELAKWGPGVSMYEVLNNAISFEEV